jgi:putative ABC transport system permease protein
MFRNYLNAALRNLVRNRVYAGINIVGLAVGFAAALFIALFVRDELSYDKWLPGAAAVTMLSSKLTVPNQEPLRTNLIPEEIAPPMKLDFPGIDKIVRLQPARYSLRHGDVELSDQLVYFADPDFFSVIQLPAVAGDLKTALDEPDSVVLTLSAARRYFGKDQPIGELLERERANPAKVTAVLKDLPSNTQFNTDIIFSARSQLSTATRKEKNPPRGWGVGSYTYFTMKPGSSAEDVAKGLTSLIARHKADAISFVGPSPLFTLPMTGQHLQSGIQGGTFNTLNPAGDPETIKTFVIVGVLLVFIAAINFINLSTARASRRALEVGMRKVVGAEPRDLVVQFIGESLLYVVFGMILAMMIVGLAMPAFNGYLKRSISFDFWADPLLLGGIVATTLIVGIAAAPIRRWSSRASVLKPC